MASAPAQSESTLPYAALADVLEPVVASDYLDDAQRGVLKDAFAGGTPNELAVARATLALVRGLAATRSVVLALDDVQWLDPPTTQALTFTLRRLGDTPVRILATRRVEESQPAPLGLDRALEDGLSSVRLGPLSLTALDRVLRDRLRLHLSRPRLVELHRACGGNPLYAIEIARSLRDEDGDQPIRVPPKLTAALESRVATLPAEARDAALLASACLQPTVEIVERAAGGTNGIRAAASQEIVEVERGRIRFTHPLLASAVYVAALPSERRDAHARLAEAADGTLERAHHLARATMEPDASIAEVLHRAAQEAAARGVPETAADLADHSCRLTEDDRGDQLLVRTALSAEYHLAAGDTARGRALLEEVVDSREAGADRARLLLRLGHVRYLTDDVPAAHALFEQALAEAGDDLLLKVEAQEALAWTAMYGGDIPGALAHARSSLELAERLGDPGLLALALCRVALEEFLAGHGLDRARMERAVLLEEHVGDVPVERLPSYAYAGIAVMADDLERPRELYDALYRSALDRGDQRSLPVLLFPMSQLECAAGNFGLAARYAVEAVDQSRQGGLRSLQANCLSAQARVGALIGRIDDARAAGEEGITIARATGAVAPLLLNASDLGFLELSLGDPAAAHDQLGPLSDAVLAMGLAEPGTVRFLPDEIEALVALASSTRRPARLGFSRSGVARSIGSQLWLPPGAVGPCLRQDRKSVV